MRELEGSSFTEFLQNGEMQDRRNKGIFSRSPDAGCVGRRIAVAREVRTVPKQGGTHLPRQDCKGEVSEYGKADKRCKWPGSLLQRDRAVQRVG